MTRGRMLLVALLAVGSLANAGAVPRSGRGGGASPPRYGSETWVFSTVRAARDSVAAGDSIFPTVAEIDHFVRTGRWGTVNYALPESLGTNADIMNVQGFGTFPMVNYMSMVYFNLDPMKAASEGKRVVHAYLWLRQLKANRMRIPAAQDSLLCMADTVAADTFAVHNAAVNDGVSPAETAHQLGITWNERRNNTAMAGTRAWSPTLVSRTAARKWGIRSFVTIGAGTTPPNQNQAAPDSVWRWVKFDVTEGVQEWMNGAPNAGFWLWAHTPSNVGSYWQPYHFDTGAGDDVKPFLDVEMSDAEYKAPWPGGAEAAACFIFDDGSQPSWSHYADKADSLRIKVTFAPELNDIVEFGNGTTGSASPAQLLDYHQRGHEIANQGWFTDLSTTRLHGRVVTCAADTDFVEFKTFVQTAPAIHLQLAKADSLFPAWGLPLPRTYVYPFGFQSSAYADSLKAHGYIAARALSKGGYPAGTLIDVGADSTYVYRVPVCYNPVTTTGCVVAGNEASTRANIRKLIVEAKRSESWAAADAVRGHNVMLVFYAHAYSTDLHYDEFAWVADELRLNGVYVDRFDNLMAYYRRHHKPPTLAGGHWLKY